MKHHNRQDPWFICFENSLRCICEACKSYVFCVHLQKKTLCFSLKSHFVMICIKMVNKGLSETYHMLHTNEMFTCCFHFVANYWETWTCTVLGFPVIHYSILFVDKLDMKFIEIHHVLAVLDFQFPCYRPESPTLYLRSLLTNHEGYGQKLVHLRCL